MANKITKDPRIKEQFKNLIALLSLLLVISGCAANSGLPENTSETSLESGRFTYYLKSSYPTGLRIACTLRTLRMHSIKLSAAVVS